MAGAFFVVVCLPFLALIIPLSIALACFFTCKARVRHEHDDDDGKEESDGNEPRLLCFRSGMWGALCPPSDVLYVPAEKLVARLLAPRGGGGSSETAPHLPFQLEQSGSVWTVPGADTDVCSDVHPAVYTDDVEQGLNLPRINAVSRGDNDNDNDRNHESGPSTLTPAGPTSQSDTGADSRPQRRATVVAAATAAAAAAATTTAGHQPTVQDHGDLGSAAELQR